MKGILGITYLKFYLVLGERFMKTVVPFCLLRNPIYYVYLCVIFASPNIFTFSASHLRDF